MIYDGRTYSVLVVSSSEKFIAALSPYLPEGLYTPVAKATSIAAAKRAMLDTNFDFVIVNAPLPDEFGTRFAMNVCSGRTAIALLLVRAEQHEEVYAKVVDSGVFTLPKPASGKNISEALRYMAAARERLRLLEKKALSVEDKMEEIRMVNRAKWLLIEHLSMTEAEAHRHIEKQAMDRHLTKKEIARGILASYGL